MAARIGLLLVAVLSSGCGLETGGTWRVGIDAGSVVGVDAGMRDSGRLPPVDAFVPPGIDAGPPPPPDAGPPPPPDAGPPPPPDAGPPPPPDAGPPPPPDAGPPPPPDAGPRPRPDAGPPSCDSRYGAAASYALCAERATECEFYVRLGGVSCGSVCTGLGGTCIAAYSNGSPACMRSGPDDGCASTHMSEICICSR